MPSLKYLLASNYSGMYGSEKMLCFLSRALSNIGRTKILLNPAVDIDFKCIDDVEVIPRPFFVVSKSSYLKALFDVWTWLKILISERPSCLVLNISLIPSAIFAAWLCRVKVVVFVRESLIDHRLFFAFYKSYLKFFSSLIVCNSAYTASMFGRAAKVVVLPDCVELDELSYTKDVRLQPSRRLVYIGRLSERKGLALFGSALEILNDALADSDRVSVVFIGDYLESQKDFVMDFQAKLEGLSNLNVSFLGYQTDPWRFVSKGDVFVAPSILPETFGLTVAESLVRGIPVVCTSVGAYPELIINDENGYVVSLDSDALFHALLKILSLSADSYDRLSSGAKISGRRFGAQDYQDAVRRLFCKEFPSLL